MSSYTLEAIFVCLITRDEITKSTHFGDIFETNNLRSSCWCNSELNTGVNFVASNGFS